MSTLPKVAPADAPNILWICTDQQRYATIGALGYAPLRTPNVDRLVAEGVAFTHAYCQSPGLHAQPRQLPDRHVPKHRARLHQRQRGVGRGGPAGVQDPR